MPGANYHIPSQFDLNLKLRKGCGIGPVRSKLKKVKNNLAIENKIVVGAKNKTR